MNRSTYSLLATLAAFASLFGGSVPRLRPAEPEEAELRRFQGELSRQTLVERTLQEGTVDFFPIPLQRGEFLQLIVEQHGVDVVATLRDPADRQALEVDTPNGARGPESLFLVASQPGFYHLEVRSLDLEASGSYKVQVAELRPARSEDRLRAAAAQAHAHAERLRSLGDAASLRTALGLYQAAFSNWERTGETTQGAFTLRRIGQVEYSLSRFREARAAFGDGLARFRRLGDGAQEIRLLNDLGAASRRLDLPRDAESAYEQALHLSRARGDDLGEVTALNNLGVLYDAEGEPQQALDAYTEALRTWRGLRNRAGEAATLHNLGTCYSALGQLPEARDVLEQALRLRQASGDRQGQGATLTALAWIDFLSGHPDVAYARNTEALGLRRRVGDLHGEATTLDYRGTILAQLGRFNEAQASYERALTLFRSLGVPFSEAHVLGSLGWLLDARGDFRRALSFHGRALAAFRETKAPHSEAFALLGLARAHRHLGDLDNALLAVEDALRIVESQRGETRSPALRSSFLAARYDFFELAIELLMQLDAQRPGRGFAARALEVSERARARSLLEGVAAARTRVPAPSADRAREQAVQHELSSTERLRRDLTAAGAPPQQIAAVDRRLRALLLANIEARTLRPSAGQPEPEPLGLEEIRSRVLDDHTALLEVALGDKHSFLWLVERESMTARVLPGRSELEELARRARGLLPRSRDRSVQRQAALAVDALSRAVLGPIARDLGSKRLLVVVDGALQAIPFAVLPTPDGSGRPLLLDREVVQLPSASVLAAIRETESQRRPAPHRVVADPVFGPGDPRLTRSHEQAPRSTMRADVRGGFLRLPGTDREARAILNLVAPGDRLGALGFAANRETVLKGALAGYRIVHFATHSSLNPNHPELSGLALSSLDASGRQQDGLLRAYEIYDLHLPADLVVLSACRTAVGPDVRGEGMAGLSHAFLHAGAARVLVSLWNVDDEATAELMSRFYVRILRDHMPPGQALREAQLSMLHDPQWSAPLYWAGFTLQGDWN